MSMQIKIIIMLIQTKRTDQIYFKILVTAMEQNFAFCTKRNY